MGVTDGLWYLVVLWFILLLVIKILEYINLWNRRKNMDINKQEILYYPILHLDANYIKETVLLLLFYISQSQ
jgi:hypothetical protein